MAEFFKPIDGANLLVYLLVFALANFIIALIYSLSVKSVRVEARRFESYFVSSVILSTGILVFMAIMFIFKYRAFFVEQPHYINLWILLILYIIMGAAAYYLYGKKVLRFRPSIDIIPVSYTFRAFCNHKNVIQSRYKKLRWWLLIYLLSAFTVYAATQYQPKNLFSVFIDNSGSMSQDLNEASEALVRLTESFPENTDVVLAIFPRSLPHTLTLKENLNSVYTIRYTNELYGVEILKLSPQVFRSYLQEQFSVSSLLSPITEAIWGLFLYSADLDKRYPNLYSGKYLLVLTDGEGYLSTQSDYTYDPFHQPMLKNNMSMNIFFDDIKVLNMGFELNNRFFQSLPFYYLINVQDFGSYYHTLNYATRDIQSRNKLFLFYFLIPAAIFNIIILMMPEILKPD